MTNRGMSNERRQILEAGKGSWFYAQEESTRRGEAQAVEASSGVESANSSTPSIGGRVMDSVDLCHCLV